MVAGTHLRTEAGWVELQEVFDTECYEPVYNLRVADYHTYFVGAEEWESGVWAHNDSCTVKVVYTKGTQGKNMPVDKVAQAIASATSKAVGLLSNPAYSDFSFVKIYNNLANGVTTTTTTNILSKFGTAAAAMNVFGGLAIQEIANKLLRSNPVAGPLIDSRELLLNLQSLDGAINSNGNPVRPDFQFKYVKNKTAVYDITTSGSQGKIWKYQPATNPSSVPYLINILYR